MAGPIYFALKRPTDVVDFAVKNKFVLLF